MGEIKRRGDSGGAVSSELDAALRELVKKELGFTITSSKRISKRKKGSRHLTFDAVDIGVGKDDDHSLLKFFFGENFNPRDNSNIGQIKMTPEGLAFCKKHNIRILDERNATGGPHFHIEIITQDRAHKVVESEDEATYHTNGRYVNIYGSERPTYEYGLEVKSGKHTFVKNDYNKTENYQKNILKGKNVDLKAMTEGGGRSGVVNYITNKNTHELVLDTYTDERGSNLLPSIISDLKNKGYEVITRKDKSGLNQDVILFENEEDAKKAQEYVRNQVTYDGSLDVYTQEIGTTTQQPTDETTTPETTTPETTNKQITIVVENNRDFKENPITDEEIRNVINYNRDSDQLKQDFKDGKLPYNSLFMIDGVLYKKGFDDAVHEYDIESRTFDDQRQFPTVINDLEVDELPVPTPEDPDDAIREFENRGKSTENVVDEEITEPEEEFPEPISKPNRLDYPLDPNKKSEGNINPVTKGKTYNEALEEYNKQERERKERRERVEKETAVSTVTPTDTDETTEVVTDTDEVTETDEVTVRDNTVDVETDTDEIVTTDETETTEDVETTEDTGTELSLEEIVTNAYMDDKGYTSEDQLTEEDKQFIQAELENASLDEETIKNQVQDKIRGDTYLQEKYEGMDINDIIMSPTFGNDFADIYDNIVVGDTEQTTVENETTNVDETVVDEDEYQGDRYGDSEREILDSIFQASDEDLDKLKQLKKDRNYITKNKVGNDKILKAADQDTAGSGKLTSEQYSEIDFSQTKDYTEVIDWNTGESFYIKTDWINRSEGQRANELRRKREAGTITAEEITELENLDSGYHSRDILTRANVFMNTEGHPGGVDKPYLNGLEEVNQYINNRRTLIIETGKDPEIQLSPEQTEIYNKVIADDYDESNLETDFELFYNQPVVYRGISTDIDGNTIYTDDEFLTTPTETTDITGTTDTEVIDTDVRKPIVTQEDVRTLGDIGQEVLKGTIAAARGVLDAFGGPDALVSAVMGKKALGVAMQDLEPQEKAKLSPMFNEQLRQSKELTKRGFHPSQERKIRKDISQAYNQGLDNAVRGTAGDRAKFLATSGILDRNRASALLEFAALDSQQQIANQDRYNQLLQFKETFDAQQKESLRSENLELALANKKAASQFAGIALGDTMSRLSDLADNEINRALKNEMFNRYNYMFNTDKTNPYLSSIINPE